MSTRAKSTTAQPLRQDVTNATGNVLSVYLNVDQSKASNCDARIEQVRGEAANKLRNVGGIGAVLRY
jgi:stalled ribosome rescue protein Dom34